MRVVIVGGGVDGLVAAIRLKRAGRLVTVLERAEFFGGIAAGREFTPGYRHMGLTHDGAEVQDQVLKTLDLHKAGVALQPPKPLFVGEKGGRGLVLAEQGQELGERFPEAVKGLARWELFLDIVKPAVRMVLKEEAPDVRQEASLIPLLKKAWMLRGIGEDHLLELMRVVPLCVDDWMAEYVDDPLVRAAVSWPALVGAWMGPLSPYSATNLLFDASSHEYEVAGGPAAFVDVLVDLCAKEGVSLRPATEVTGLQFTADAVTGAILADGEVVKGTVLWAAAPSALLDVVPAWQLPARMARELTNIRVRGSVAKFHLALSKPLAVAARDGEVFDRLLLGAEHPLDLERAFDDVKHRRLPRKPWLDVRVLRGAFAPEGHCVASVMVHCAAYDLDGGWTQEARDTLTQRVLDELEAHCPGVRDSLVHCELLAPSDLEEVYGLPGGHLFHGERMVDQLYFMRPSMNLSRHSSEVPGLYFGSMGTHPGGGVTGAPGLMAAERVIVAT
ncbi:MAG: NAD(P)/FAD-dependent oxidoreductase [Deltaproteobacteria bacterium]|nr:MAG: NAD(P)/FAD-dependent oxidoreductase [Deltaproteobacteria bacterium]